MLDGDEFVWVKLREPDPNGISQTKFAAFGEQKNRCGCCDGFGKARQVEDGIRRHSSFGRLLGAKPISSTQDDLALVQYEHYGTRDFITFDGAANGLIKRSRIHGANYFVCCRRDRRRWHR